MHLVDTNIFLELLLDQEKKKFSEKVLKKIANGEIKAVISGFSLHSIEFILSIKRKTRILKEFLQSLSEFPNLSVYHTNIEEDLIILEIMEQTKLDFDDANQYFVAKKFGATIITFDHDFKVIKDIDVEILK
jgi:hypothetical protein